MVPRFLHGQFVITRTANEVLHADDVRQGLQRHLQCDWGELEEEDRLANDLALQEGSRLLSAYSDRYGTRFWIITEADRSMTTVLLPDDY